MKNHIGNRLSKLRKKQNLSQSQLAQKLGITFQAVSKWETGTTYPDIEMLPLLSDIFGVSIDHMINPDGAAQKNLYNDKYNSSDYYWGVIPNPRCFDVMKAFPAAKGIRLLDIGCGEGKDAVFFAKNGYHVTAFDLSPQGIKKTDELAKKAGVQINSFVANVNEFRLSDDYDIMYSSGTLHYIKESLRKEIFDNYIQHTRLNGIHSMSAFVDKPFIPLPPDHEETAHFYKSGELFTYYTNFEILKCDEIVFDCMSSGIAHKHCSNTILAKKI